jgi:hypothetical protein
MNGQLKLFLSHSSKDKKLATDLKDAFERLGLDVFVAHQDIKPSVKWADEILRQLRASDIFLALLTKNFKTSDWADQEAGIAISLEKVILPVVASAKPHGFLSHHQAYFLNHSNLRESCAEIALRRFDTHPKLRRRFRAHLVSSFAKSPDFNTAIASSIMLNELQGLTATQVNRIVQAACDNDQILKCKAFTVTESLINNNKHKVLPDVLNRFYTA